MKEIYKCWDEEEISELLEKDGIKGQIGGISLHTLAVITEEAILDGTVLSVTNMEGSKSDFESPYFSRFDPESLEHVFFYAVSLGGTGGKCFSSDAASDEKLLEQDGDVSSGGLYAEFLENMRKNECLQAGVDYLANHAGRKLWEKETKAVWLSGPFGPGYYGMGMESALELAKLLDFGKIGAWVDDSGTIRPFLSKAGFWLALNKEPAATGGGACEFCLGNRQGCILCGKRSASGPFRAQILQSKFD